MNTLKKSSILLTILSIWIVLPVASQAKQINIAVYASTTINGWSQRGVPSNWGNMFDYSINLDDELADLVGFGKTSSGDFTNLSNVSRLKSAITPALITKVHSIYKSLKSGSPLQVRFVLMGEGPAGGYLMRILAGEAQKLGLTTIKKSGITLAHVEFAVVTVGTPNQGFPLAEASYSSAAGMRNIQPTIDGSIVPIKTAFETKQNKYLAWVADAGLFFVQVFGVATLNLDLVEKIGEIRKLVNSAPKMAKVAAENLEVAHIHIASGFMLKTELDKTGLNLKNAIGPGHVQANRSIQGEGSLIRYINSLPNPAHYRSVIGSEKTPTPVRLTSEIAMPSNAEEAQFKSYYDNLKRVFKAQADAWNIQAKADAVLVGLFSGADSRDRRRRDNYNRGVTALKNLDSDWGYIIGSYRYETRTGTRRVYDPNKCSSRGAAQFPMVYNQFPMVYNIEGKEADLRIAPIDDPNCDPWVTETYIYTVRVPLKNDGVLSPHYAVWKRGDSPNDKNHNWHYSDAGDGGYNALELMRYKRTYTQGANKKGERAKPMDDTRKWLLQEVL